MTKDDRKPPGRRSNRFRIGIIPIYANIKKRTKLTIIRIKDAVLNGRYQSMVVSSCRIRRIPNGNARTQVTRISGRGIRFLELK